jgi:hypothetical protein
VIAEAGAEEMGRDRLARMADVADLANGYASRRAA